MYQVIGTPRSRTLRVLWMLEELDVPYEHVAATPHSGDVKAKNPAGKIPVLIDQGCALTDSTAIIQYLADKHGAFTYPAGTLERARQDGLTQMLLDEFDAALWVAARHQMILPEDLRQGGIRKAVTWELARSEKRLADRLGDGPFLMGNKMTVPDIILTHCGGWALSAKLPLSDTRLKRYFRRMRDRPAYQRALALA